MNKPITLRLQGGLGNQLFQLLALRYLAATHPGSKGVLFTDHLQLFKTPRQLSIAPFIQSEVISNRMNGPDRLLFTSKASRLLARFGLHAVERVAQLQNWSGQYLNGYFQDIYRYAHKDIIRAALQQMNAVVREETGRQPIAAGINDCAVHLRLTDFVETPRQRNYLLTYRIPFIKRAIERCRKENTVDRFILFSDAPAEAMALLNEPGVVPVQEMIQDEQALFSEFCLMSSFRHLVASNSTFSFWAALLGNEKQVVFPAEWNALHATDNKVFASNIEAFSQFTVQQHKVIRL
jgi:hypothetical protein